MQLLGMARITGLLLHRKGANRTVINYRTRSERGCGVDPFAASWGSEYGAPVVRT